MLRYAADVVGPRIVRIEPKRLGLVFDGAAEIAGFEVNLAAVEIGVDVGRIESNCLVVILYGAVDLALRVVGGAAVVERVARPALLSLPDWMIAVQAPIVRSGSAALAQRSSLSSRLCASALVASTRPNDVTTMNSFPRI